MSTATVAQNVISFAVEPRREEWLVSANLYGELVVLDVDTFVERGRVQAHPGPIWGLEFHPELPYLAAVGKAVTVWRHDERGALTKIHEIPLHVLDAENDDPGRRVRSHIPNAMAVAFHPTERRLLTRSAALATVEVAFDDDDWQQTWGRILMGSGAGVEDPAHVKYVAGEGGRELVLSLGQGGTAVVIDPSRRDEDVVRFRYDGETLHWAEHVEGTEYLIASDTRRIFRLDVTGRKPPLIGPAVARDHIEMVRYNRRSGRAFAPSFDRNVTEVDPVTLESRGIVWRTPFKLRHLATLERAPDVLLVRCNNGALYKANLREGAVTGILKHSPNALWSAAALDEKRFVIAGEGREILVAEVTGCDPASRQTELSARWVDAGGFAGTYTKRAALHPPSGLVLLARTDGEIRAYRDGQSRQLIRLGSAVRDIATAPEGSDLFAICEDGTAHRIDLETGAIVATFRSRRDEPLWSLAYNHERRLLAATERDGHLYLLDARSLHEEAAIPGIRRGKRARWRDADRLLLVRDTELLELDVESGLVERVIGPEQNTIEDFAWDSTGRYLACITYVRDVLLFRFDSYDPLFSVPFDDEIPKGILWLDPRRAPNAYPFELVVHGRTGIARMFRVWSDRLISAGVVNTTLSTPVHDEGHFVTRAALPEQRGEAR